MAIPPCLFIPEWQKRLWLERISRDSSERSGPPRWLKLKLHRTFYKGRKRVWFTLQ